MNCPAFSELSQPTFPQSDTSDMFALLLSLDFKVGCFQEKHLALFILVINQLDA